MRSFLRIQGGDSPERVREDWTRPKKRSQLDSLGGKKLQVVYYQALLRFLAVQALESYDELADEERVEYQDELSLQQIF